MIESAVVAEQDDVETRVRRARAELASRALQIRTIEADVERFNLQAAREEQRAAKELLRQSLAKVVESRRAELQAELAAARQRAARLVAEAREQAALLDEGAHPALAAEPAPPPAPAPSAVPAPAAATPVAAEPLPTAEYIAQIVQAAVAASLSHAAAVPPVAASTPAVRPPTWGQRLLHLDVLLPLVLVVIVVAITLAWVS